MRIGIVGFGVVGRALKQVFEEKAHEVLVNDLKPHKGVNASKEELVQLCDIVFICVQTPTKKDGSQDLDCIDVVLKDFSDIRQEFFMQGNPLFIIKSTVLPETTNSLRIKYPNLRIVVNPEFLRQVTSVSDARNPDRIVIGTPVTEDARLLFDFYKDWNCPKLWFKNSTEAELVKYFSNAFAVYKVAFSCEADRICNIFGCDSKAVMHAVAVDKRFSESYLKIQGAIATDSPCLPKDIVALRKLLKTCGVDSELLDVIWKIGVQKK